MRISLLFILSFLYLSLISCDYYIAECQYSACAREFVKASNMEIYCGQEIGCRFYLRSVIVDGSEYFSIDCHCADMLSSVWDCDGVEVCAFDEDCILGLGEREARIVGVRK